MPWQEPNMMTEEEGWAVTAYVIQLNRMNPGELLNAENAAEYRLHPEATQPTPTAAAAVGADLASADPLRVLGGIALVALAIFSPYVARRRPGESDWRIGLPALTDAPRHRQRPHPSTGLPAPLLHSEISGTWARHRIPLVRTGGMR
jgi:hypothetical protein